MMGMRNDRAFVSYVIAMMLILFACLGNTQAASPELAALTSVTQSVDVQGTFTLSGVQFEDEAPPFVVAYVAGTLHIVGMDWYDGQPRYTLPRNTDSVLFVVDDNWQGYGYVVAGRR